MVAVGKRRRSEATESRLQAGAKDTKLAATQCPVWSVCWTPDGVPYPQKIELQTCFFFPPAVRRRREVCFIRKNVSKEGLICRKMFQYY